MDDDRYVRPSITASITNHHLPRGSPIQPKAIVMMRPPPSPPRSSRTSSNDATNTSTNNKHNNSPTKQPSATASSQSAAPPPDDNEGVTRHAYSREQMDRARVIAAAQDEVNVGIMAVGLAWVERQREGRRRQYLRNQAERQLRKIADAEKGPARQQHRSGLSENPIFQNLSNNNGNTGQTKTTTNTDPYDDDNDQGAADSSRIQFGTPQLSKSGEGVSGRLQIADMEDEDVWTPKVRVEEEPDSEPTYILNADLMQQIAINVLPKTVSYQRWKRLYGLERDGDSFGACLRIIENLAPTLLVVKTTRGDVFGGYADSPWNSQELGSNRFYGGAQACLFKVIPGEANTNKKIKVFRWSGANRYIQLCDISRKMIAFGGGGRDGAFGLCVEEDFLKGSTGSCDTFNNEPLCDQENFEIMDLEFWGFMAGVF